RSALRVGEPDGFRGAGAPAPGARRRVRGLPRHLGGAARTVFTLTHAVTKSTSWSRDWRWPGRLLLRRPASRTGLRGGPLRRAAHALRPGARGRGAGPSEDQVGDARVREDRREAGLPLLRRRRAGFRRAA